MFCLCYVSTRNDVLDDNILKDILMHSRAKNINLKLTGLLVLLENKFIQILEGEETDVLSLYSKIKMDHRHKAVQKLYSGYIQERNFKNWAMAFHEIYWEDLKEAGLINNFDNGLPLEDYLEGKNHYIIEFLKSYNGISELQINLPK
ncbi:BLUF domain-containing protein [Flammeovirga pectinis]|uniref:BLUF domain-containing protein n=1 Tax=Flammeovirga pectinis TaxID=2494373 RepID=A0A3Q9FST9_9BACT|nr:BLUF domain-containing protein [Flammeovirga pectinis]AZQ64320.1 BLUF domain-containing protein [Flammeovirga pectinis]